MAKSTQDLCFWLRQFAEALAKKRESDTLPDLYIKVYAIDKSFSIIEEHPTGPDLDLYRCADDEDINDLCYWDAESFVETFIVDIAEGEQL